MRRKDHRPTGKPCPMVLEGRAKPSSVEGSSGGRVVLNVKVAFLAQWKLRKVVALSTPQHLGCSTRMNVLRQELPPEGVA